MKRTGILALGTCLFLILTRSVFAYDFIEVIPPWPDGSVKLEIQLGTSPRYSDGTTPNETAIEAAKKWNPYMGRVQLTWVNNSTVAKSKTNGRNNVFFSTQLYDEPFPDGALAVTLIRATDSTPEEADVVVHSTEPWDSYRGALNHVKYDVRRVLAHEFGHVLGLDHPDEAGQWVTALMNSRVSDLDAPQEDDQNGVAARYGPGTANPSPPPEINSHPQSISVVEGNSAWFYGSAFGAYPIQYQWLKNGAPIPGETDPSLAILNVNSSHAGNYSLRATNHGGSVTSNEAALTVTAALPPTITSHPMSTTVETGATLSLSAGATSNAPITFQWTRDNTPIPGAIYSGLSISNMTSANAGEYRLIASTSAGTATSNAATVTVIPAKPPTIANQPSGGTVQLGGSFSFYAWVNSTLSVTYRWTRDGVVVPGATGNSLYLSGIRAEDAGEYRLEATSAAGTATSNPARLVVIPLAPPPVVQLANTTVAEGSALSIYPSIYPSDSTYQYQWYKNGAAIPSARNSSYYVTQATAADAGEYFVVVTNASGSVTSTTMIVTVTARNTSTLGGWKQVTEKNGTVYFLFENPARIERFALASDTWLSAIPLTRAPTAIAVAPSGAIIVAFSRTLVRVDPTTREESAIVTLDSDASRLVVDEDQLYILAAADSGWGYRRMGRLSLTNPGSPTWSATSYYLGTGLSIDPAHGKAFTLSEGISPSDIGSTVLNDDGTFGNTVDSAYHGDYPNGTQTTVSPDCTRVFDNSGIVYSTTDLTYIGSVGGAYDGIVFRPDGTVVVLRSAELIAYDTSLRESGSMKLTKAAQAVAVFGDHVYTFTQPAGSGSAVTWQKRPLSDLSTRSVLPAISAGTVDFAADTVMQDRDGNLLLFSRIHGNIFRWSAAQQRYLQPIPLMGWPNFVTYSPSLHRIYLGYADNRINAIDLDPIGPEQPFATAPQKILGLCAVGEHLFLCDPSGAWVGYFTYDRDGGLVGDSEWRYWSRHYVWNANKRRVYHFRDDTSPNDLGYTEISADGTIGTTRDSPYHGELSATPPICISPGGDVILLGSGKFYNADTLEQNNSLPHGIADAAWLGTTLFTARDTLQGVLIERWGGSNYGLDATYALTGRLLRVFAASDQRLVVAVQNGGRVAITVLDANLSIQTHFAEQPDLTRVRLANLSTRGRVGTGDNIMIAGFVVSGSTSKRVLVRAIGPTLHQLGVNGELLDPQMSINNADSTLASNDDWHTGDRDGLKAAFREAGAFNLPEASRDAAVLLNLPPGAYTVLVSGKSGTGGIALVETYDLDQTPGERHLINISTRGWVGTGDAAMIPGMVIDGSEPKRVLIRAIGPGMSIFNLNGLLADPYLHLVNRTGDTVLTNDDWGRDNPDATAAAAAAAGAFGLTPGSKDAAVVTTLDPGVYTVIVSGVGNTSGLALVEVYEVP